MSGKNQSLFDLPPGLNRTVSQYAAGPTWWNGNLVRWVNKMLIPIGGWVKRYEFPLTYASQLPGEPDVTPLANAEPIRAAYSWRDFLKKPWAAYGSSNRLWATSINTDNSFTFYDITPAALGYNPGGLAGYGSGAYGKSIYGISPSGGITIDEDSLWSLDNFGKLLVGVASQDGRLVTWDPAIPGAIAAPVTEAPIDNTLVIATDEEFLMVMGGVNNPRRVKWPSRRTLTDWVPTATNSAGGFDLQSNGTIIGACLVPGGVLVVTDTDAHILEYVGPPSYYGRRRVSDECDITSAASLVSTSFGAIWLGHSCFWSYNGAVSKVPTTVDFDVFYNSELSKPHLVHGGVNQFAQEAWWFFPSQASNVPDRYVAYGFNEGVNKYWTSGHMTRTAWLNPVWQDKPIAINNLTMYLQETGDTADGELRGAFAETGAIEINDGDTSYRIDRIYPDVVSYQDVGEALNKLSFTFKMRQAPNAPELTYGPIKADNVEGYTSLRMRARQIALRIDEVEPGTWGLGKIRLRIKQAGVR